MDPDRPTVGQQRLEQVDPVRHPRTLVDLPEGDETVEQDEDPRLVPVSGDLPVLGDARGVGRAVAHRTVIDRLTQGPQEPGDPLVVGTVDDAPDVREGLKHRQTAVAEVEAVDVRGASSHRETGRDGEGPQQGRLARPGRAEYRQVALEVGAERDRGLLLAVGVVEHAEDELVVAPVRGQRREVVDLLHVRQPRLARLGDLGEQAGRADRADEPLDVGRTAVLLLERQLLLRARWRQLPLLRGAEGQRLDPDVGTGSLVRRPPAGVAGLEGDEPARTGLRHAASGDRRVEERRLRGTEDVVGVRLVGHAQGDPQVRVGAEVVLDDPRRALRREDEVDAERSTSLGDVDDAVDEVGHLLHERGELVDDDDETRRGLDLAAALELDEVLRAVPLEEVLPVMELGGQRGERAAHEVRAEVGDHADGVGEVDAVPEGRPALVVDEEEGDPLGRVRRRHAEDPRLERLGLAGSGRPSDEGVRTVGAQVERVRALAALAEDRPQRPGLLHRVGGGVRTSEDRSVLAPPLDDRRLARRELGPHQGEEGDGPGQVRVVGDDGSGVGGRRHPPSQPARRLGVEPVLVDGDDDGRLTDEAHLGALRTDLDEGAARGGELVGHR